MKVIILKEKGGLGKVGDVKEVAGGYARNFLIPEGIAKPATEGAEKEIEILKETQTKKSEEELKSAEELAESLEGLSIEISAKADESGKLFAAISQEDISKALEKNGFKVEKSKINIAEPIKEVGEYEVMINLDHGLEARIEVVVARENL
jgi:large subunit ribosomal protein L9